MGRALSHYDGSFVFLCVAKVVRQTAQEDALEGRLFIFDVSTWKKSVLEYVAVTQKELLEFCQSADAAANAQFCSEQIKKLERSLTGQYFFYAEFSLRRSGTCKLTQGASENFSLRAPKIGDDKIVHMLCSQLFYFLKDISHNHQHHSKSTDTIVDLIECHTHDDFLWRRETLFSLYRKIVSYKRNPQSDVFYSSLGVLAYAETFMEISKAELSARDAQRLPTYYNEQMRHSILAVQAIKEN
ncbi:hypothetical protein CCP2SC5_1710005 [Azospirillaceae bacterium]